MRLLDDDDLFALDTIEANKQAKKLADITEKLRVANEKLAKANKKLDSIREDMLILDKHHREYGCNEDDYQNFAANVISAMNEE